MLDIFLFVPISQLPEPSISPSINQVKSIAMSNSDGFTSNHLLQQMYEPKVLNEDLEIEFSEEELELIAGGARGMGCSYCSDIFINRRIIVDYSYFVRNIMPRYNDHQEINYIWYQFRRNGYLRGRNGRQIAAVIWNNLRDLGPVAVKRQRRGFTVDLNTGQLFFTR